MPRKKEKNFKFLQKFTVAFDLTIKKLDVFVDMPTAMDLETYRAKGLLPGEEVMPSGDDRRRRRPSIEIDPAAVEQVCNDLSRFKTNYLLFGDYWQTFGRNYFFCA